MICLKIFQSCLLQDITEKPTEPFSEIIASRHAKNLEGYEQIYLKLLGTSFAFLQNHLQDYLRTPIVLLFHLK